MTNQVVTTEELAKAEILVIDDDMLATDLLIDLLESDGYRTVSARDGAAGMQVLERKRPDLVLLDLMMPRMDGWETCRRIRQVSDIPIVVVSGKLDEQSKVRALDLGADDFITKPFGAGEFLARVRVGLRHRRVAVASRAPLELDGWLTVDRDRCEVWAGGRQVALSATELKLLYCFLDNPDRVLTHQILLCNVWGWEYADDRQYIKVYINHLRNKIEPDPRDPRYIVTERGLGYRFRTTRPA